MSPDGNNLKFVLYGVAALSVVLLIWVVTLQMKLSSLKSRYDAMMTGDQSGRDFEGILNSHVAKCDRVIRENIDIKEDIRKIQALLNIAVTRIGIVRFSAFSDIGGDFSYAVALLDQNDDGVVFSCIFGREDSRCYAKPVKHGDSEYKLTDEEKRAIREAKAWGNP